jgi:hypothetical protein
MECLGLHNKPMAEVHLEHLLMGPEDEVVVVQHPIKRAVKIILLFQSMITAISYGLFCVSPDMYSSFFCHARVYTVKSAILFASND